MVPSVQTLTDSTFDNLTIIVVVPLDPRFPRTTYAGVTTTGLTTRDLPDASVLNREVEDFDSLKELSKIKRQLLGDFFLKNNTIGLELPTLSIELDPTKFRMFRMPSCVTMSNYFMSVPIDHF